MSNTHAQNEIDSNIEINTTDQKIFIGAHMYTVNGNDDMASLKNIIARFKNNFFESTAKYKTINLGLDSRPKWLIFSITNNTTTTDWVLDLGRLSNGRTAILKTVKFMNLSTTPISDITGLSSTPQTALNINIPTQTQTRFALLVTPQNALAGTIKPSLMSRDMYIKNLQKTEKTTALFFIILVLFGGFFLSFYIVNNKAEYTLFTGYYAIVTLGFPLISSAIHSNIPFNFALCILTIGIIFIYPLFISRFFFGKNNNTTYPDRIFTIGVVLSTLTLIGALIPINGSTINEALLLICGLLSLFIVSVISIVQKETPKISQNYTLFAWLCLLAGISISAASLGGTLPPHTLFINAFWFSFIPQGLFFILAISQDFETEKMHQKHLKSREERIAQSLVRLKHSKESADQARLLRVIERERELMTELREREMLRTEEMRYAKDAADEANRAKSAFLAVVSHEVRTPMTGILGMVRLLNDTKMSQTQNDYVLAIQKSGDTMMALLNDILDFEKIEQGSMKLEKIDFDLEKLVEGIVTLMSGQAGEKNVKLSYDIPNNCPQYVIGDPTRLRQILLNLTNNAIKFTENGSVTIVLKATELDTSQDGIEGNYEIRFSVKDTGIGISQEAQDKLFTPFIQADDTVSRRYGGTGLGLAISKRLVEAMSGNIGLESKENVGSTFYFDIIMDAGSADNVKDVKKSARKPRQNLSPLKILVVEDNEMNRKVLKGLLEKDQHNVTLAQNGEEAIKLAADERFDAILMDINLSAMSGFDTTQHIRDHKDSPNNMTPIIALTGNVSEKDIATYYTKGLNDFVGKPIDPKKLHQALVRAKNSNMASPIKKATPPPPVASSDTKKEDVLSVLEKNLKENTQIGQEHTHTEDIGDDPQNNTIIDTILLSKLIESLGEEQFNEILIGFWSTADNIINELNIMIDSATAQELHDKSHELKGMAANFGMIELSAISTTIEKVTKDNDLDTALSEIEKLSDANQRAQNSINDWLNSRDEA